MGKLINIDGSKLKALLESATGKTLATLGVENGYSKSILTNAVRRNTASPAVVALVRLYGIEPSAYELKESTPEEPKGQLSIEDLATYALTSTILEAVFITGRKEFKAIVKEAIREEGLKESKFKEIIKEAIAESFNGAVITPAPTKDYLVKDPDRFNI